MFLLVRSRCSEDTPGKVLRGQSAIDSCHPLLRSIARPLWHLGWLISVFRSLLRPVRGCTARERYRSVYVLCRLFARTPKFGNSRVRRVGEEIRQGTHGFCSFYSFGAIRGKPLLRPTALNRPPLMASKIPALLRPVAFAACPRVKSGMFGIVRFCFFLTVYWYA